MSDTAKEMGRRGGLKGGPARAKALSPDEHTAIARKAARARWGINDKGSKTITEQIYELIAGEIYRGASKAEKMRQMKEIFEELIELVEKGELNIFINEKADILFSAIK